MATVMKMEKIKAANGENLTRIYSEIERRVFRMADLKSVPAIPYKDLLGQVDYVVGQLARKLSFSLDAKTRERLVAAIAADLVKEGQRSVA